MVDKLEKVILRDRSYVDSKFLDESRRWKALFNEEFDKLQPKRVKKGRSKSIEKCQLSPPMIRFAADRDNADYTFDRENNTIISRGGMGNIGKYQITANLTGYLFSDNFSLGFPQNDGFKMPVIVRTGRGIIDMSYSYNSFGELDNSLNYLAEEFRNKFKSEEGISEFLREYIVICDEFIEKLNYERFLGIRDVHNRLREF